MLVKTLLNQGLHYLAQQQYSEAVDCFDQLIRQEPDEGQHYIYLGLALLLAEKEDDAQYAWLMASACCDQNDKLENTLNHWFHILDTEAHRQENVGNLLSACSIRWWQHQLFPPNINNLIALIRLSAQTGTYSDELIQNFHIIDLLTAAPLSSLQIDQLLAALSLVLAIAFHNPTTEKMVELCCFKSSSDESLKNILFGRINQSSPSNQDDINYSSKYIEIFVRYFPEVHKIRLFASNYYKNTHIYNKSIEHAEKALQYSSSLIEKIVASGMILRTLARPGNYWDRIQKQRQYHQDLILQLSNQSQMVEESLTLAEIAPLVNACYLNPYLEDNPEFFHRAQHLLLSKIQTFIEKKSLKFNTKVGTHSKSTLSSHTQRRLKIGYLSYCFRRHSVGWLTRQFFRHHNTEEYEIFGYAIRGNIHSTDPIQKYFSDTIEHFKILDIEPTKVAEEIASDDVDILVDLDSITFDSSCLVMQMKPAKIQATWLGWGAAGNPMVDYFIADPYVLPDNAQTYFKEKIWRLPDTYIAIDGFAIGIPSLRRDQLSLPSDGILYLCVQNGMKRNPQMMRLQLQILKAVPNSFLLVKGVFDQDVVKEQLLSMAEQEGVGGNRLRFLPYADSEVTHRADLAIADVVLDTYPYNGATTTLETLWMGIPLVTRVGKQFAARNSYTMMKNVGLIEGVAWDDEEYLEWGIRLGNSLELRQHIHWKLWKSRQISPLWNAKKFTLEMEKAYQQMWEIYISS